MENELRETEINRLHLVRNINEVFWTADHGDTQAYFISPAFDRITGVKRGQFYMDAESVFALIHPDDVELVRDRWLCYGPEDHEIEFRLLRPDGELRWLRDRTYAVRDPKLNIDRVIGLTGDITTLKQEQELKKAIEIELQKHRFLHEMIRDISHDIQSPITAIMLKIDLLERTQEDLERQQKYLNELRAQTHYLSQLLDQLFTLIRLESRPGAMNDITTMNEIVQEVIDAQRSQAEQKHLILEFTPCDLPLRICCNAIETQRAFTNLVQNAIRYTPDHGRVSVRVEYKGDQVMFIVQDTGMGIREADLPHIFERFFRASNASKMNGTGLGLAITKQIVQRHGGRIEVESKVDIGTRFTIFLPIYNGE